MDEIAQAEKDRKAVIEGKILLLRAFVAGNDSLTSEQIKVRITELETKRPDEESFEELIGPATAIYTTVMEFLVKEVVQKEETEVQQAEIDRLNRVAEDEKLIAKNKEIAAQASLKAEKETVAAQTREQVAKDLLIESERKHKEDLEQAKVDAQIEVDRKKAQEARDAAKRAADVEHMKKVNNIALIAIHEAVPGIGVEIAKQVVVAIAKKKIQNITINY